MDNITEKEVIWRWNLNTFLCLASDVCVYKIEGDEKVNKISCVMRFSDGVWRKGSKDVFIKFSDCNIDISDILWNEVEALH